MTPRSVVFIAAVTPVSTSPLDLLRLELTLDIITTRGALSLEDEARLLELLLVRKGQREFPPEVTQ